jgi:hypothetical protein
VPGQLPQRHNRLHGEPGWLAKGPIGLLPACQLSYLVLPCHACLLLCRLSHTHGLPQRFLPDGRLATKSSDGRMYVWRLESSSSADGSCGSSGAMEVAATWKVPHCSGGSGWQNRCQFGGTADGRYIAAVRRCCTAAAAAVHCCCCRHRCRSASSLAVCAAAKLFFATFSQLPVPVCLPACFCEPAGQQQGRLLCV